MPQRLFFIHARLLTLVALSLASLTAVAADKDNRTEVSISGLQFKPAHIKIHVGDTVAWINNDDRDHTVVSQDGLFKSKNIKAGKTFEFKFSKPGTYPYGCNYHPRMKGVVVVE